jgi:D-methionine transport system permease protein
MLESLIPNWDRGGDQLIEATWATLQMVGIAGVISFILGTTFGVLLVVAKKGGILENLFIYNFLDKAINGLRSIPFLILMILLIPVSRAVVGTGFGVAGAIIPLVFGTTPFFARQIESAIAELDSGLIEVSLAMGLSPIEIIFSVYLRESIPSIARVTQITAINLIALTTFAGAIGAGGLGEFAIRFGHQMNLTDLLWVTIIIILILVSIIQGIGNIVIKWTTR